jgi:hypothetical protein
MAALLFGLAAILNYARACEDIRLKGRMIGLAIAAFVFCFVWLFALAGTGDGDDSSGPPARFVVYIALGCALLTAVTYICQRIVSHYLNQVQPGGAYRSWEKSHAC